MTPMAAKTTTANEAPDKDGAGRGESGGENKITRAFLGLERLRADRTLRLSDEPYRPQGRASFCRYFLFGCCVFFFFRGVCPMERPP